MGRAIVRQPQAFLMDEPLSNLDAKLRVQMRAEISRIQTDLGVTTIYVTHDQVEAMTMGDRVAVMRRGELQQVDEPQILYDHPVNLFVAGFIGSPTMNMLQARLERHDDHLIAVAGDQRLLLDDHVLDQRPSLRRYEGRDIVVGVRPEDLQDAQLAPDTPAGHRLLGQVVLVEALGSEVVVHFLVKAAPVVTEDTKELAQDVGVDHSRMPATRSREESKLVGRFDSETRVRRGQEIEVAVDTRSLHFFDLDTGLGIYDQTPSEPQSANLAAAEAA
jgi:multiple sugar transport system ATP-binding protein